MKLEIKIFDKEVPDKAKLSVLHFVTMHYSGISHLPTSYLEEPEPK